MSNRKLPPIHPGEILQEEFLGPLGISQYRVAKETSEEPHAGFTTVLLRLLT
jgi:antitoxin HigA-1